MMYAFCLFCETQRCRIIAEYINSNYGITCFSPRIIQRKWVKGIPEEVDHDLLPGYLFLYTEDPILPRFDINGIIRCLGNETLKGSDLSFAEMVYSRNGIIGNVLLIEQEKRCKIKDPAWEKFEGRIIKMDRGRKRCCLEYYFDGSVRTVWVGYEMAERVLI